VNNAIFRKKFLIIATITVLVTGLTLAATLDDAFAKKEKVTICHKPGTPAENKAGSSVCTSRTLRTWRYSR